MSSAVAKLSYLTWALPRVFTDSGTCPACDGPANLIRRKYLVTALRECTVCHLRFRTPREDVAHATSLYSNETYTQGFTTDLPSPAALEVLMNTRFVGSEKNYARTIEVLFAAGLRRGARILDFGCSWGYGSWQLKQAGFDVLSYEIGRARAAYAEKHLNCVMVSDLKKIYGTIDCFFSSHVIEHLPNPRIMFDDADRILTPQGIFVSFCPNGSPERERATEQKVYDMQWNSVHPLLITPEYMRHETTQRFSRCTLFSDPYDLAQIMAQHDGRLDGGELLSIAYKR